MTNLLTRHNLMLFTIIAAFLGGVSRDIGAIIANYLYPSTPIEEGISFIQWFVFALALISWKKVNRPPRDESNKASDNWFEWSLILVSNALLLIPSAILSWAVLLLIAFALYFGRRYKDYQSCLLILMALSVNELSSFVLLKFFTLPVLTIDAMLTAGLLNLFMGVGSYDANVVTGPAGHKLMVLRGCSSISSLALALLVWFSIARFRAIPLSNLDVIMFSLISLSVIGINVSRLTLMSIDIDMHTWFHNANGELAYQVLYSVVLLTLIRKGLWYE